MLWAYLSFSQFLIIWSGNLPEEIPWYIERIRGALGRRSRCCSCRPFFLPFALLLSRDLKKRQRQLLAKVAIFILVMRLVDLIWLRRADVPALAEGEAQPGLIPMHWMDIAIPVGLDGPLGVPVRAPAAQPRRCCR